MQAFKDKKREQAQAVLNSMSSASDRGLLNMMFSAWVRDWKDWLDGISESNVMKAKMAHQKQESRRVLEKSMGAAMLGSLGVVFHDWRTHFEEQRAVWALQAE